MDGLNTHDDSYQLSISGGLTTANILPGSADAIGKNPFQNILGFRQGFSRWTGVPDQTEAHSGTLYKLHVA